MTSRVRQSVVLLAFVAAPLVLVRGAFASEPAGLAARAAAIDRPAVIGAVRSGPIAFGRAVVTPRAGARVWLLGSPEKACALWLDGGGTLVYTIDDPVALPVARRNLKSASALRFEDSAGRLTVREELKSAVIWGWELAGAAARESGAAPAFPAWVSEALEKRRFPPPSSVLIESLGNGVPGVVYALLDGEKEPLLFHADPRPARAEEKLTVLWKLPPLYGDFAGDLEPYQLSRQPIGRTFQAARPQEMVASRYEIAIEQTGKRTVRVRSKVSLKAARAGISVWAAELDHETSDDGTVYGVRVLSASVDGKPAAAHFENGVLLVELGRVLGAGGQATLEVVSEGEHASRPNQDSFWWLGFGAWYPRPVERRDLAAEYEISIDVAGPWIPYASGKTVKRESDGARNRLVTRLAGPMQAPVVTVGSYSEVSEAVDGVRVNVASYAFEKPEEGTRLIRNFGVLRQCLEKLFQVPYPFEEVDILEVNSWGFGMAPAGVVLVTREAFTKTGMVRALGESSMSVNEIFAHEIAHAYWANVVKYDSGAEQWLSESFSEYTSALCLAMAAESEKEGKRLLEKMVNQWRGNASQIRSGVAIATANDLAFKDDLDAADRIGALYARGPLVLHAIRGELARQRGSDEEGDRYFSAFMRAVVKNFALRPASTEDLIGILEQITKQPWRPFFDRHVYGPETPKVK